MKTGSGNPARLAVPILLLLSAGFTAGEASNRAGKYPKPVKACGLWTAAEAEAALGGPVDEPKATHRENGPGGHWMSACSFHSPKKNTGIGITLTPLKAGVAGAQAFAAHEAELREALGDDYRLEPVAGLGDRAGWDPGARQLTVFRPSYMLVLSVSGTGVGGKAALELAKALAGKALAGLPKP